MEKSPFSRLSGELRNKIYDYAFHLPPITLDGTFNKRGALAYQRPPRSEPLFSGLPGTCKAMRRETHELWKTTSSPLVIFINRTDPPSTYYDFRLCSERLRDWACAVGRGVCKSIRTVILDLGTAIDKTLDGTNSPTLEWPLLFDALQHAGFRQDVDFFIRFIVDPGDIFDEHSESEIASEWDIHPFQIEFKLGDEQSAILALEARRPCEVDEDEQDLLLDEMAVWSWISFEENVEAFINEVPNSFPLAKKIPPSRPERNLSSPQSAQSIPSARRDLELVGPLQPISRQIIIPTNR